MKKVILIVAVLFGTVINAQVTSSNIDVDKSNVNWKGFKPTGEHFGTISISEGNLEINEGALVGGSFVFDMNTIVDTDMPADNKYNAQLVDHLKSADFFDVTKYPTATFVITSVKKAEGGLSISGDLTIKDVTKNITFTAKFSDEGGVNTLTSEKFMVNRADYNVTYKSKTFFNDLKDKFINDEFEISFEVKATHK
ncbi:MAG: YceI family protein [Urechidicola sp.]|nr:YceI family protein [Urechidicola sp.]